MNDNSFHGASFASVEILSSTIGSVDRHAFRNLRAVELTMDDVNIAGEIETDAFSNLVVGRFTLRNSRIGEIGSEAFRLNFSDSFLLKNLSVRSVETRALFQVRPKAASDAFRMEISSVFIDSMEDGSLLLEAHFGSVIANDSSGTMRLPNENGVLVFENNRLDSPCRCDGYKLSVPSESTHRTKFGLKSQVKSQSLMLADMLQCRDGEEEFVLWRAFDELHCGEEEGHDHDHDDAVGREKEGGVHIHVDGDSVISLTHGGAYAAIGAVLLLLTVAMAVLLIICYRAGTKNSGRGGMPVLPIGEEDDGGDWPRVSFTRVLSREEQERCQKSSIWSNK